MTSLRRLKAFWTLKFPLPSPRIKNKQIKAIGKGLLFWYEYKFKAKMKIKTKNKRKQKKKETLLIHSIYNI